MMKRFLKSFGKSIEESFAKNEYIVNWRKKYPKFFDFLKQRLSFTKPFGFYFSAGILLGAIIFFYFLSLAVEIVTRDLFVEADIRLMNLITAYRSTPIAKIFLWFTYLGNWQIIITLGIIVTVIFGLLKERRKLKFLIITVIGGELFYSLLKLILHRSRPGAGFSLIAQNGYSFPSGHAVMSLLFYGMIGYFVSKALKNRWLKAILVILFVGLILSIGFSRIYLGVHWVSDVLAGWLLGLALLIFAITFLKNQERFSSETKPKSALSKNLIIFIAIFLLIFEGAFLYYFHTAHSLIETTPKISEKIIIPSSTNLQEIPLVNNFPKFSENLVGQKMEPISFIFIGSEEQIIQIFQKSGWVMVDEPHRLANLYRLAIAAAFNRPYVGAPVTPAFLNAQPNFVAFEKATEANTVRQRHHIRFWPTEFYWNGIRIWVATASFDDGLRYLITHKIRPDIDTERDYIKNDLDKTDLVKEEAQIQLVGPLLGTNQSGDQFFTDGKAYVLFIK